MSEPSAKEFLAKLLLFLAQQDRSLRFTHRHNGLTITIEDENEVEREHTLDTHLLSAMNEQGVREFLKTALQPILDADPFSGWDADRTGDVPDLTGTPLETRWTLETSEQAAPVSREG